ncbi:MAG TPA: hypothetical protein VFE14_09295, partial [Micromonosporaceae bacterium]|nr:hypothetical protein [Micromonosporaceae bacterium]
MGRTNVPWYPARLLTVAAALMLPVSLAVPVAAFAAPSSAVSDIPACDADDPEFGTNCEDEDAAEEAELRDGYLDSRQIPGDVITPGDLDFAAQQAAAIPDELHGLVNPNWSLVGPSNVGGRVTDIAPDHTQPGTVFVAVATAGLWKSTDAGVTMTKAWP